MTTTLATQIDIDAQGMAWIVGTRVKVIEVVLDKIAHGWSPEEMHFQHPNLSLAQIHGALTYYYENQEELDRQILEREALADELEKKLRNPELQARLLAAKLKR